MWTNTGTFPELIHNININALLDEKQRPNAHLVFSVALLRMSTSSAVVSVVLIYFFFVNYISTSTSTNMNYTCINAMRRTKMMPKCERKCFHVWSFCYFINNTVSGNMYTCGKAEGRIEEGLIQMLQCHLVCS